MNGIQEIFIQNLKRLRKEKGLSQLVLSEKANLSPGMIGDIETGRRNPTLTTLEKISNALDVPTYYLLYDRKADWSEDDHVKELRFKEQLHQIIDDYWCK